MAQDSFLFVTTAFSARGNEVEVLDETSRSIKKKDCQLFG